MFELSRRRVAEPEQGPWFWAPIDFEVSTLNSFDFQLLTVD